MLGDRVVRVKGGLGMGRVGDRDGRVVGIGT